MSFESAKALGPLLRFSLFAAILVVFSIPVSASAAPTILNIDPIPQHTAEWCWLAALEMVFKYHDVPSGIPPNLATNVPDRDYQISIVANTSSGLSACRRYDFQACVHGAGNQATKTLGATLYNYPPTVGSTSLVATTVYHSLSADVVKNEIDNDRPIIAGVNTSGRSGNFGQYQPEAEHAVVIVGYDQSGPAGDFAVVVNDPFDYRFFGVPNPWLRNGARSIQTGQYELSFAVWTRVMPWIDSIYNIHDKS
jgi:hypothetical protein